MLLARMTVQSNPHRSFTVISFEIGTDPLITA
jgi:hypothetical protein